MGVRAIKTTKSNTLTRIMEGVNENEPERRIHVYPNPSSGKFTIRSLEKISSIELVNLLGETIFLKTVNNTQEVVNLDERRGVYFLHVKTPKGIIVKKIIRE